jgi:hypothetical protein
MYKANTDESKFPNWAKDSIQIPVFNGKKKGINYNNQGSHPAEKRLTQGC